MLQRAASNAYSWWVASHIRTKQSKWLEQSLQDMEEKSQAIMKLISEDGDSFAQRANMYYKSRPELLNFVEESFRAYRALAERFDHISKELQNANSTLASAFPDQFQFAMEEDDDEFGGAKPPPRRGMVYRNPEEKEKNIPSVPKQFPTKNIKAIIAIAAKANNASSPVKKPAKRSGNKAVEALRAGFNKTQAIDEIDNLQKKILTKQTEKEFTKSSYENGVAKYWQIEKEITEMQEKVSNLQDVFGVGKAIEDNEARTLMLEAALKSCQQSLADLQEQQAKANAEAEEERKRIRSTREKIASFRGEAPGTWDDRSSQSDAEASPRDEAWARSGVDEANATKEIEMLRDKMKLHFDGESSVSVSAMVEKIDELVNKVITLDTAVTSQKAMVRRMKEASGELENMVGDGKSIPNNKIKEVDLKLKGLRELESTVQKRNNNLNTEFTEASGSLAVISEKLPDLNLDEVIDEDSESAQATPTLPPVPLDSVKVEKPRDVPVVKQTQAPKPEKVKQAEDEPNWQQLFNDELEKEKALKMEYASVLENYEQIKKKLGEVEDKSEGSLTELRELRDAIAKKDEEIQSLREKLSANDASSVLQSYEEVKKKLGEVEGKSQGNLTELSELKDAIAKKDEEIRSLRDKLTQNASTSVLENNELKKKLDEAEDVSEESLTELKELRDANAKKDEEIQSLRDKLTQNASTSVLENNELKKKLDEAEDMSEGSLAELKELRDANAKKDEEIRSLRDKLAQNASTPVLENNELIKKPDEEEELNQLRDANAKKDEEIRSFHDKLSQNASTPVLENNEVRKKPDEEEELNQLRDANAKKDEEIQSLRDKLTQNATTDLQNNEEEELNQLRDANARKDNEIQSLRNKVLVLKDYEHKSLDNFVELKVLRDANCRKDEEIRSMRDKMVILQKKLEEYKTEGDDTLLQAPEGDDMLKLMRIEEPREMSPVEASLRADIDEILEENLDFWMRFSSSFAEIQKYYSQVEDLKHELSRIEECKTKKDWGNETGSSFKATARAIYKHLKEIQTDLTMWMERSLTLKDELQCRFSQLCKIQEQITQALNDGAIHDEMQFTSYQAAKFQGEVLNMQQENNKVADELQASLDNVTIMQIEVEKITSKLTEDLGIIPASKIRSASITQGDTGNKNQVPLRSFIFGVKPKKQKQSIFSVPPVLHKKYQQLKS